MYDATIEDQPTAMTTYLPWWLVVPSPVLEVMRATTGLSPSGATAVSTGQPAMPRFPQLPLIVARPSMAEPASGWQKSIPGVVCAVQRNGLVPLLAAGFPISATRPEADASGRPVRKPPSAW